MIQYLRITKQTASVVCLEEKEGQLSHGIHRKPQTPSVAHAGRTARTKWLVHAWGSPTPRLQPVHRCLLVARAPFDGRETIPTLRSRPKPHPKQLSEEVVAAIVEERLRSKRCSEVIRQTLVEEGVVVSPSSVKRTLARNELLKSRTKWKRKRLFVERPLALAPGDLVQVDTIHFARKDGTRFYVCTLIDL